MRNTATIQLAHGGGGRLSRDLIEEMIVSRFGSGPLLGLPDGATLPRPENDIVFTTDSYVVQPHFFPGGDIGSMAVHGTVNDLAVSGAEPLWLSLALILEEGLPFETLASILDSIQQAATVCNVQIVTGDTKVVARGQADGIYINTAGIGRRIPEFQLFPDRIQEGDAIIVSGTVGDHGMAVMAARHNLNLENPPQSDSAPVHHLITALAAAGIADAVHLMRDPTRGGLATVLNEWAETAGCGIKIKESALPFNRRSSAAAELLGIDLLYVACEGRVIAACTPAQADAILSVWRDLPGGENSACIGIVTGKTCRVGLETCTGAVRLIDVPQGELLPRIC